MYEDVLTGRGHVLTTRTQPAVRLCLQCRRAASPRRVAIKPQDAQDYSSNYSRQDTVATHRQSIRASDPRRRRSRSSGCVDRPIDRRLLARVHLEGLVDHGPGTKDNGKVVVASTGQWLSR